MSELYDRIAGLFALCGVGAPVGEIEPVSGGLMHKMYKVRTCTGVYAVKCLNPGIMKRPGVLENYARAEKLESLLEESGVPIVPALMFGTGKMIKQGGFCYYIFPWQEGSITDPNNITEKQCFQAGEILGQMHRIDPSNVATEDPELSAIDFRAYVQKAEAENSGIADLLRDSLDLLADAQEKLNAARSSLPPMLAIDDPDMDPKNIMWHEGQAHVIDLECLEWGNPIATCLDLALQWAGTVNGKYDRANLKAFFYGYLGAYDNGFRSYDELFGIAYTWVEWLEYNIRRALGMEAEDADEKRLGEAEVKSTIGRISYLKSIEGDVREVLNSLPRLNSENYKTHDDLLCYIDLVFEGKLTDLPEVALPEGYRLVTFEPGDRDAWIDIERSAQEVLSREHGEACWERYYGSREQELPGRMWFVENAAGEKVATATALYDIHGAARPGEGQLHWVAVKKEYQGRGLSKPLITYVLQVMKRLGYDSVKIHTQTNTWLACGIYYDLGFRPSPDSRVQNRFGWKMVEQLTGKEIRGGCPNSQMNTIEIGG